MERHKNEFDAITSADLMNTKFPPFSSTADLKAKLDGPLAKELQQKDGMIITCGHRNKYARGVRIEQYKAPGDYQSKING